MLLFVTLGYPVYSHAQCRRVLREWARKPLAQRRAWAHFLDGSYRRRRFYFRHANFAAIAALGATLEFCAPSPDVGRQQAGLAVNACVLGVYFAVLARCKPFKRSHAWQLPVKLAMVVVSLLSAVVVYVNFLYAEEGRDDLAGARAALGWTLAAALLALLAVLCVAFAASLCRRLPQQQARARSLARGGGGGLGSLGDPDEWAMDPGGEDDDGGGNGTGEGARKASASSCLSVDVQRIELPTVGPRRGPCGARAADAAAAIARSLSPRSWARARRAGRMARARAGSSDASQASQLSPNTRWARQKRRVKKRKTEFAASLSPMGDGAAGEAVSRV